MGKQLTEQHVIDTLRTVGDRWLTKKYKHEWDINSPTNGYCYIVAEVVFHYVVDHGTPICISFEDGTTHWYVRDNVSGQIVDFTRQQFGDERIPYERGVGRGFMKGGVPTSKGFISKRAHELALLLGVADEPELLLAG